MYTMTFWEVLKILYFDQKQTFRTIPLKSCSRKFNKIHRKTSVLESLLFRQNSHEEIFLESFLIKLQAYSLQIYQKRDFSTCLLQWNLSKQLFYRTSTGDCFSLMHKVSSLWCSENPSSKLPPVKFPTRETNPWNILVVFPPDKLPLNFWITYRKITPVSFISNPTFTN